MQIPGYAVPRCGYAERSGRPKRGERILDAAMRVVPHPRHRRGRRGRDHARCRPDPRRLLRALRLQGGVGGGGFRGLAGPSAARWERISQDTDRAAALARIVDCYLDPAHVAASGAGCVLTTLGPGDGDAAGARAGDHRVGSPDGRCVGRAACLGGDVERALAVLSTMVGAVVLARPSDDPEPRPPSSWLQPRKIRRVACACRPGEPHDSWRFEVRC